MLGLLAAFPVIGHAGGGIDLSFNVGAGTNDTVNAVLVQGDSKVVIVGLFTTYNDATANNVARLNVDGSLDPTFNSGQGVTLASGGGSAISTAAFQSDGKIILGGVFDTFDGRAVNDIVRLNTDGSVDTTFNVGTGPSNRVARVAVDGANRIYVAGPFQSFSGSEYSGLCRLNPDGSLDTTFSFPVTASNIDGISTILFGQENLPCLAGPIVGGREITFKKVFLVMCSPIYGVVRECSQQSS